MSTQQERDHEDSGEAAEESRHSMTSVEQLKQKSIAEQKCEQ